MPAFAQQVQDVVTCIGVALCYLIQPDSCFHSLTLAEEQTQICSAFFIIEPEIKQFFGDTRGFLVATLAPCFYLFTDAIDKLGIGINRDKVFLREESLIPSFLWHDIHVIAKWPSSIDDGGIVYVTVHISVVVILRFLVRIVQYGIVIIGLHKRIIVYALLFKKQKQDQTQKKRGQLLIHIPGVWPNLSEKQVTSTHNVNVCIFYSEFFCGQTSECLINSKRYILPSKIIPPPCTQGLSRSFAVYDTSAVLECKDSANRAKCKINCDLFCISDNLYVYLSAAKPRCSSSGQHRYCR